MHKRAIPLFAFFALAGALSAADSQLVGLTMPDVKLLAGIYPDRLPVSFQQYLLALFPVVGIAEFRVFMETPGLDAGRDIHEVLAASANPVTAGGLILARGVFNVQQVQDYLTGKGRTAADYNGVPLISNEESALAIAMPDSSIVIAGRPDEVKAALDRMANPAAPDAALAAKADDLSKTQDAWYVSIFRPEKPDDTDTAARLTLNVMAKAQQATLGIKFGATVDWMAQATMDTAEDCKTLAGILRAVSALGLEDDKQRSRYVIEPLLGSMVITSKANVLTLSITLPVEKFQVALSGRGRRAR